MLSYTLFKAGFGSVTFQRYPTRRELSKYMTSVFFITAEDYSYAHLDRDPATVNTGKGDEFRAILNSAVEEMLGGAAIVSDFCVAVGQKPEGCKPGEK